VNETSRPVEFLTSREVYSLLRVSRSTGDRLRRQPGFPRPIRVGGRLRWFAEQLEKWIQDRAAEARQENTCA
jgi:predicted DNA-binding transcriptional regulator AlpA